MYFQPNTFEQETLPASATAFRRYLEQYQIELFDVAVKSGVRYMTVWRIGQGQPINSQHERLIRQGLLRMTGIPYTAPVLVHGQENQAQGDNQWTRWCICWQQARKLSSCQSTSCEP